MKLPLALSCWLAIVPVAFAQGPARLPAPCKVPDLDTLVTLCATIPVRENRSDFGTGNRVEIVMGQS